MPSLTQMNKKQLIEEAIKRGVEDENSLKKIKRKELIDIVRSLATHPDQTKAILNTNAELEVTPKMGDEGWTDYVLSLLRKNEMQDGNPTLFGLRRIAQKLLSNIVECRTDIKQIPNPGNNYTATVVVSVKFSYGSTWYGAADVSSLNCMEEYAKHPTATAESRAEGRALRKALGINVHTVDEVGLDPVDTHDNSPASTNQMSAINSTLGRLNIYTSRLLALLKINKDSVESLSVKEGIQVLSKLQEFLNNPESIPGEITNAH